MVSLRIAISWELTCGLLGSGLVVFPPLAARLSAGGDATVVAVGCLAVLAVGLLFLYRPFGLSGVASVSQLPVRWRMIYAAGFAGGSSYFASTAISLLELAGTARWTAIGCVLVVAVGLGLAPAMPAPVKLVAALTAVLALTASPAVTDLLGRRSDGGIPLLIAIAAAALLAVGWEVTPRRGARRAEVLLAGMVCCLVIVACSLWVRYRGVAMPGAGGDPHRGPAAVVTAAVLTVFVSHNLKAIGAFCAPRAVGISAVPYRLLGGLPILALVGIQRQLLASGWLLSIPAVAMTVLYGSYLTGLPKRATRPAEPSDRDVAGPAPLGGDHTAYPPDAGGGSPDG